MQKSTQIVTTGVLAQVNNAGHTFRKTLQKSVFQFTGNRRKKNALQ